MIYLISNQKSLFKTDLYKEISFEDAKSNLEKLQIIQFDTETNKLDPHSGKLLTYQLGNKENQYVFDNFSYPINLFKYLFESDRIFIIHNALFDLKWCYKYDIWPKHVYDTMLAEQIIWLGWGEKKFYNGIEPWEYNNNNYKWPYLKSTTSKGKLVYKFSTSLKAVSQNRLNIELDKTVRGKITKVGLIPEVIQYAGTDVEYLEDIKESQQIDIERENLQKAIELENEFVKVLAYIEFCGVKLDVDKWKAKMAKDRAKLNSSTKKLNDFVLNYFDSHNGNIKNKTILSEYIVDSQWIHDEEELKKYNIKLSNPSKKPKRYYTKQSNINEVGLLYCEEIETPFPYVNQNLQMDFFQETNFDPYCTINWSSPQQLVPFFELLGFKLDTFDKATKQKKKSTDSKTIKAQRYICPELVDAYINYKEASKVCSSFGENWLKAINPITNRIHADFHQLGTFTARLSSGGGESGLNLQQIPRDAETRACFVSEEGNKWISEDYQSQESRLLASVANDAAMLHIYEPGECADMHALVAYMSYPNIIPRETNIADIASLYKECRQNAKSIEFCINYGGTDATMVQNNGLDPKEAKEIYDSYMKGFPGVKKYQEYCRKAVIRDGYILMNPITGHRCHIIDWDNKWIHIKNKINTDGFWQYYKELKYEDPYGEEVHEIREYFKLKSDLEKDSINYRIQNRGSMCSKLAGILLFKWIIKNNYQNIVKICIPAHDEYNIEAPESIAEEVALILQQCMEKGAKPFCTRLPLSSDVSRLDNGELPTYWIH